MNNTTPTDRKHYFCVILAGGKGRRLWPVSREERPKQFIDFFGTGMTLLQQTYERIRQMLPVENIYVSTYAKYTDIVHEQLPLLDDEHLLREPIRRNTAPIVSWATHRINMIDPNAAILVTPADQVIINEQAYQQDVLAALKHVTTHQCLLTMGIRPTRPEPGYGYIQMDDNSTDGEDKDFYRVKSFTEKPEREFAEMFIQSGEFLWNTGLFISTVPTIREQLGKRLPAVMRSLDMESADATWQEEEEWVENHYSTYPNMSLENGILEHSDNVCVKECHFGWADIGSWHGIYEHMREYQDANVLLNTNAELSNSHGNIISMPEGHMAIINGLNDFIVAEHDDILLITPRNDSSNEVIKMLNQHYMKLTED